MIGIESLKNSGIDFIGDQSSLDEKQKTLVVIGVARSGTSLIAGSLEHLGVFTGARSRKPVFEDVTLANAIEDGKFTLAKNIIKKYNKEHDIWAYKRPASIELLDKLNIIFRNPIYLIVFKDMFSIANRNNISVKLDVIDGLKKAHVDYEKIINFISNTKINAFLFSYEKIMANKIAFMNILISMIGKEKISIEQEKSALIFIKPSPEDYLDATRTTRSKGFVKNIDKSMVSGWAMLLNSYTPVVVELYINGKYKMSNTANKIRLGLVEKGIHKTGTAGFIFDLKDSPLQEDDIIEVKVKDDIKFLKKSNMKEN